MLLVHSKSELEHLREAGRIVAKVHTTLKEIIKEGITTLDLNNIANDIIKQEHAEPAFLGYKGFPYSICTSVNEVIVHGFPSSYVLKNGDLISVDVGCKKNGFYGDAAFSVIVGNQGNEEISRLLRTTKNALELAVNAIKEGVSTGTIGRLIEEYSRSCGFYEVRNYVGHGIGRELHMAPQIYNYGRDIDGVRLKAGMCICVEPMLCVGSAANHRLTDGWTVVTNNGKISCHFEHQIIIHKNHAEVITM